MQYMDYISPFRKWQAVFYFYETFLHFMQYSVHIMHIIAFLCISSIKKLLAYSSDLL